MFQKLIKLPIWTLLLFLFGCASNKPLLRTAHQQYVLDSLRQDPAIIDGNLLWRTIKVFDPGEFRYLFLKLYLRTKIGGIVKIDRLSRGGKEVLEIELDLDQEKIKRIKDFVKLLPIKQIKDYNYYFASQMIADKVYNDVGYDNCLVILKSLDTSGYYVTYCEAFGNIPYKESPQMHVINFMFIKRDERQSIYEIKDREIIPPAEESATEEPTIEKSTKKEPTTEDPRN